MTTLLSARDIRAMAAELQLRPTKQRGQNFVIDPNTVRMIVSAAGLSEPCTVAEVGPGLGSLTLGLLDAGHHVIAVEIDELLASRLPRTVAERCGDDAPFDLVVADALRVTELPVLAVVRTRVPVASATATCCPTVGAAVWGTGAGAAAAWRIWRDCWTCSAKACSSGCRASTTRSWS